VKANTLKACFNAKISAHQFKGFHTISCFSQISHFDDDDDDDDDNKDNNKDRNTE
jgi:hypothetical protein